MDRVEIIKEVTSALKASTYLEIGVNDGFTFLKVKAWKKVGVDPTFRLRKKTIFKYTLKNPTNLNNKYISMYSDDFFLEKAGGIFPHGIDVAFIDGLHTFEQSLKDVQNTLKLLKDDGIIIMHDCSPPGKTSAYPAKSLEEARKANLPGWTNDWCGDVWKTIPYLRASDKNLNIFVLDCDYGVGIVKKGRPEKPFNLNTDEVIKLTYDDLDKDRAGILNLKAAEYLTEFIRQI